MSIFSFSNPILLGSVDTGALMNYAMCLEKVAQDVIKVFRAIVSAKDLNLCLKLRLNHRMEVDEHVSNLGFIYK